MLLDNKTPAKGGITLCKVTRAKHRVTCNILHCLREKIDSEYTATLNWMHQSKARPVRYACIIRELGKQLAYFLRPVEERSVLLDMLRVRPPI